MEIVGRIICSFFYALGCLLKAYKIVLKGLKEHIFAWASLIIFILIAHSNYAAMGDNSYSSPILFIIGACLASYFTIYFSKLMYKYIPVLSNGLIYLGKRSLDIVIWQFAVFRIVILLQMRMNGIPFSKILSYYPVYNAGNGWWIAYTLVGIVASLILGSILKKGFWGKVLKRIYVVS